MYIAEACGNTFAVMFDDRGQAQERLQDWRQSETWTFDSALVLHSTTGASVAMSIHERDGSVSAMCGNGLRALGAILDDLGLPRSVRVDSGVLHVERSRNGAYQTPIRPAVPGGILRPSIGPEGGYTLYEVEGEPHAVAVVDQADHVPLARWARHVVPLANCTILSRVSHNTIRARTFERGVNRETPSCGTGACAAATAAVRELGFTARRIQVSMTHFVLTVNLTPDAMVLEGSVNIFGRKS